MSFEPTLAITSGLGDVLSLLIAIACFAMLALLAEGLRRL